LVIPDLLCAEPSERIDLRALRQTLVFAFAAGASLEMFDDAIAGTILPPSTWDRADFARDVFLDKLVVGGMPVRLNGKAHVPCTRYLVRAIGEPPRDRRDVDARRAVLAELASSPAHREALENAVLAVVRLRGLLCAARQPAPRVRRLEILRASRETFESLACSFEGAKSSLWRVRSFGAAVIASPEHQRLVALLDHDEHLGSLDLRVRMGADGEVRAMQLLGVRENRTNPFHVEALRRFFARVVFFFRGYRLTRGEIAERLLADAFSGIEQPLALLFQLLGDAEVLLASLGMRDRSLEAGLAVSLPTFGDAEGSLRLEGLFNPLLLAPGFAPIPCDVQARPGAVVLVTGPNSGGKTRLLQALAISQLLAQGGFFVPVRDALVPRTTGLFASLSEEARSDQPEGHLGMELLRIKRMFTRLPPGGIVVLDELCSGTNPSEGEEIARLVLSLLPELGVQAFVTTHLLAFAARLAAEKPSPLLDFLQVELDAGDRPTYQFVAGVAKTSLAHKTAARLGVTREELLEQIRTKRLQR
jgi:DNA mismatch repair protein MutS2